MGSYDLIFYSFTLHVAFPLTDWDRFQWYLSHVGYASKGKDFFCKKRLYNTRHTGVIYVNMIHHMGSTHVFYCLVCVTLLCTNHNFASNNTVIQNVFGIAILNQIAENESFINCVFKRLRFENAENCIFKWQARDFFFFI